MEQYDRPTKFIWNHGDLITSVKPQIEFATEKFPQKLTMLIKTRDKHGDKFS